MKHIRIHTLILILSSLLLLNSAHAEERSPEQDNAQVCYAAYYAAQKNPGLQRNAAGEWSHLESADFDLRVSRVAPHIGGIASTAYADTVAKNSSGHLAQELSRFIRPAVLNAAVARIAHCDQVYAITPAISPNSDDANKMTSQQALARERTPEEIVTCNQLFEAGAKNKDIRKSPIAAAWSNLDGYDFFGRQFDLDLYAEITDAYDRVPQLIAYPAKETSWEGRLAKALQDQDVNTQTEFLKEVAACDAKLNLRKPLQKNPLADPTISHKECGARYNSLIPFYAQAPQTQAYFQQRMVMSGRYMKLFDPNLSDQEILSSISTETDTKVKSYLKSDGAPDPQRLMEAFSQIRECDRQYSISITEPPRDLYRAARMAE